MENIEVTNIDFPVIAKQKRIIPNEFARSSLFTVSNHKMKREYFKDRKLETFGEVIITYTGEELRQDDEDVWLQIIFEAYQSKSNEINFMPYTMIKQIEWPGTVQYREKLKQSILRMVATNISIYYKMNSGISLSLVRKFIWHDAGKNLKKWQVVLEPEIVKLFADTMYSKLIWDQRKKLKPLAKWLYAYYSTHAKPFPLKLETLRQATGSKTKQLKHFKVMIRNALLELVAIDFLKEFFVDANNLVHVHRANQKQIFYKKPVAFEFDE